VYRDDLFFEALPKKIGIQKKKYWHPGKKIFKVEEVFFQHLGMCLHYLQRQKALPSRVRWLEIDNYARGPLRSMFLLEHSAQQRETKLRLFGEFGNLG
jgi:hypothetical protein